MTTPAKQNKFQLQDEEYGFPYHYLVDFQNSWPEIRTTRWAWEYFSYVRQIQSELTRLKPDSVLDVGCGDGLLLNTLGDVPEKNGLDLSERSIQFAKAFASDSHFHLKSVDDWEQPADVVTLVEVIEHIPDNLLTDFLSKASDLAKQHILISVPTDVMPVSAKHYRHYNENMLKAQTQHLDFDIVWQKRVFKKSILSKLLTRVACNRLYQINSRVVQKQLWRIFSKSCLEANERNGVHLIALLTRKT